MSMTNVTPGWYDDGSGRQRWWDGRQWGQYAPGAPAPGYGAGGYGAPGQGGVPLAPKELGIAYALMLFTLVGVAGIQHFYLGKVGRGILWLLTFGLLGIGTIVDIFTLPSQVKTVNARRAVGIS